MDTDHVKEQIMCCVVATKQPVRRPDDDEDGAWTELRPFTYYARHRTAEQRRRLWAMVGGRPDEWTDEND